MPNRDGKSDPGGTGKSADIPTSIVAETIVVIDVVESTLASNLFGWYSVGRETMKRLRKEILDLGRAHQLRCVKSTGDGYLLSYGDDGAAELSVAHALEASFELIARLGHHNSSPGTREEARINVRVAVHFGPVDVVENDREGPNVSYAFRLEAVNREALQNAIDALPRDELPLQNYVLCSEPVRDIVVRRGCAASTTRLGLLRFKGFPDWHEVFLVIRDSKTGQPTAATKAPATPDTEMVQREIEPVGGRDLGPNVIPPEILQVIRLQEKHNAAATKMLIDLALQAQELAESALRRRRNGSVMEEFDAWRRGAMESLVAESLKAQAVEFQRRLQDYCNSEPIVDSSNWTTVLYEVHFAQKAQKRWQQSAAILSDLSRETL